MPTTSRLSLPYPQGSDVADVPQDVQDLADNLDVNMVTFDVGLLAARTAAGTEGRFYFATDNTTLYFDDGSSWQTINSAAGNIPVGAIMHFGQSSMPSGFVPCDGAAISRTTYSALFAAISTTYGVGDGSTTFNVPDLDGKMVLGEDGSYALGSEGGAATHALSEAELPAHDHPAGTLGGTANSNGSHDHTISGSVGSAGGHGHTVGFYPETGSGAKAVQQGTTGPYTGFVVSTSGPSNAQREVRADVVASHAHSGSSLVVNSSGSHTHTLTVTGSTGDAGSGNSHNNLPPYVAVGHGIYTGV